MGRTRRRSERQRQKLKDRFSQSEANEAVDFEITLAALLATANLAYQHPEFPLISQGAAFGILLLTLVRRVSLLSSFADQKRLMKHTIPFIEFSAVTGVIALLFVLQLKLEISLSWFWAAVFFAIILVITVHELVFRDQILWWHFKFAEKFESKKDSKAWAFMTFKTWEWSNASETESGRHRFYSGPSGEIQEEYSRKEMLWLFFKGVFGYIGIHHSAHNRLPSPWSGWDNCGIRSNINQGSGAILVFSLWKCHF